MNRLLRCCVPVLCAGLIPLLTAVAQTAPAPAAPRTPAGPQNGPQNGPGGFKNLKVLPDTISRNDLRALMRSYTGYLGVECEFCHAAADPVTKREDRASDANPVKDTARFMIEMTQDLNDKYLAQMPDRRYADPITCGTCHRGEKHPSIFVPPPRPEGNRPPGGPGGAPPAGAPPARRPGN
jgi:hypothetical protein